jgi:ATP-dependent DNA ligase
MPADRSALVEGVVTTGRTSRYAAGKRSWVKVKNPKYWRRDDERAVLAGRGSVGRELV